MAFLKKTNIPMSTSLPLPNTNNKTGEAAKINELVNKTNRSNIGQNAWTSTTSGLTYNTTNYPDNPLVFNKGETGLYNLLIELYGKEDGFLIMAEDYNSIIDAVDNSATQAANAISIADSATSTANSSLSKVNSVINGTTKVGKASTADSATKADSATSATNATSAATADKTQGTLSLQVQGSVATTFNGRGNVSLNITRSGLDVPKVYSSTSSTPPASTGDNGDLFITFE